MIKCLAKLVAQTRAREIDIMNAKFPTPEERKHLLRSFYDLPPKDKEMLYKAVEHLRWLTILWDLGNSAQIPCPVFRKNDIYCLLISCYK